MYVLCEHLTNIIRQSLPVPVRFSVEELCTRLAGVSASFSCLDSEIVLSKLEWAQANVKAFGRLLELQKSGDKEEDEDTAESKSTDVRQKIW